MSTLTVTRITADGTTTQYKRRKQGRHAIQMEMRKVKFSARIAPTTLSKVLAEAKKHGMTKSKYADIALALFEITDYV